VTRIVIDALLVFAVAASWLACLGFARLPTVLDRMHCVTFLNVASGLAVTIAVFVADGVSDRALKMLLILVVLLVTGAALAHATGRALLVREAAEGREE
jgi:multicomponent Na+:H+ antiporter subunit G